MQIVLLRSSLVVDDSPGTPEPHRFLSSEGRQMIRALGNRLRLNDEPSYDRFLTSPHAAAVQTSELFADRVDYIGSVEVLPALAGNVPPQVIAPLLLASGTSIVVCGDEPSLSVLGAFLIGRPTFPPLLHAQISVIEDRRAAWCLKPGDSVRQLLLVA